MSTPLLEARGLVKSFGTNRVLRGVDVVCHQAAVVGAGVDAADAPSYGSHNDFGTAVLLAEMFAQLLEARGFTVDRRPGLGATEITFQALRTNEIDAYPEYTGTGLLAILDQEPTGDAGEVYRRVAREFRERYGARWMPPLGFQNTYAIAVRREAARPAEGLRDQLPLGSGPSPRGEVPGAGGG